MDGAGDHKPQASDQPGRLGGASGRQEQTLAPRLWSSQERQGSRTSRLLRRLLVALRVELGGGSFVGGLLRRLLVALRGELGGGFTEVGGFTEGSAPEHRLGLELQGALVVQGRVRLRRNLGQERRDFHRWRHPGTFIAASIHGSYFSCSRRYRHRVSSVR